MSLSTTIEGVTRWHHHYDDPKDDIVLISRQGTGFRVSSHLMSKHSLVIKNQLAESIVIEEDVKPDMTPKYEQTGLPDDSLGHFLDLITVHAQSTILQDLSYQTCVDLLRFSELYQCTDLTPKLKRQLPLSAVGLRQPTTLFLFAAGRNDWALGQRTLSLMIPVETRLLRSEITSGTKPIPKRGKNVPAQKKKEPAEAFFDALPTQWRTLLMTLLVIRGYQQGSLVEDWSTIAKDFVEPPAGHAEGSKRAREA